MGRLDKQRHPRRDGDQQTHAMPDLLGIWATNLITRDNLRNTSTLNVNFVVDDEKVPFAHLQRRCPPTSWLIVFEFSDNLHKYENKVTFSQWPIERERERELPLAYFAGIARWELLHVSRFRCQANTIFWEGNFRGREGTRTSTKKCFPCSSKIPFVGLYSFSYLMSIPVVSTSRTYA